MRSALAALFMFASTAFFAGCPPAGSECARPDDCQAPDPAPCERCAPLATAVCVGGACAPRGNDTVDVTATISVDRHLTTVQGLAWAIAVKDRACADLGSFSAFPADLNAVASGQKSLSGGTVHPDVPLGRTPAGELLLIGLGTDAAAGDGNVVAHGCAEGVAAAPAFAFSELALAP